MLTKQDKAKLVIELAKQGKNYRKISKQAHVSFGTIGAILRKETGSGDDKGKEVQAFELFSKGLKPLDVMMKLDMKAEEVRRLYIVYHSLCGLEKINDLYMELGDDIELFFRLHMIMKELGFSPEEIASAVKYGNDLPILQLEYESLKEQLKQIEDKKQNLISELENLENAISVSRTVLADLVQVIQKKTNEIKSLGCKEQNLSNRILELMRSQLNLKSWNRFVFR